MSTADTKLAQGCVLRFAISDYFAAIAFVLEIGF
jgi:hypothetical protein